MERRLTAILSADVKGYSRLMGDDEEATVRTITAYREVITSLVHDHRGRVVDSPGDNVLAEFPSVVSATQCAIEIQHALKARNAALPDSRQMQFRIGLNLGDVIADGERIYGDGVNIAARVQGLAEGGGICLSGTAYDQVKSKLALAYESLGAHAVKNIAEPVRVYRVRLEGGPATPGASAGRRGRPRRWRQVALAAGLLAAGAVGATVVWQAHRRPPPVPRVASESRPALSLPDKPSIAVLPFVNISGDPEQEYFSDGMTEDVITDLSKVSGLFVIARNSTFTYKGKPVKVQQVSEELGVRYVLEGSVRKADDRLRITAQLVDATTGYHLWADRYDRDLKDVFALQDEITGRIVAALAVTLTTEEQARVGRASVPAGAPRESIPTRNPDAYDAFLRGRTYHWRFTRQDNLRAREMFARATALDPEYAQAYAQQGWTHLNAWAMQWDRDPRTLARAFEFAQKTLSLDDALADGFLLAAHVYLWRKQHERAIAEAKRALALSPSFAPCSLDLGQILIWAGRPREALPLVQKALRLDPRQPVVYLWALGHAYWLLDRPQEAIAALKQALTSNPDFLPAHGYLAVIYSELGRKSEARAEGAEVLRLSPQVSLQGVRETLPYRDEAVVARFLKGARDAGLR